MIGKNCAYTALVLVAALGTLQAAPIAAPPADLIRDDVPKAWWGDCWRARGGRAHCRRCWYGARGQVHCTLEFGPAVTAHRRLDAVKIEKVDDELVFLYGEE
jgi:hypothetical protein